MGLRGSYQHIYDIIHDIPYFFSVYSLSESNSCSYAYRAHNLKKRDANHWEKGDHTGAMNPLDIV